MIGKALRHAISSQSAKSVTLTITEPQHKFKNAVAINLRKYLRKFGRRAGPYRVAQTIGTAFTETRAPEDLEKAISLMHSTTSKWLRSNRQSCD